MRGKLRWRDGEFLDVIEAAAVHLPSGTIDARALALFAVEPVVERHEVERGADPADGHDQVEPAQQQVHPFAEEDVHVFLIPPPLGGGWSAKPTGWGQANAHQSAPPASSLRSDAPSPLCGEGLRLTSPAACRRCP